MEKDGSPQLITPDSVKAIISRIQSAQLTRTQELSNILDNVNSVISRFQRELGYDLREKSEPHQLVEKGKNRYSLLEKITSLSTDAKTKEKHLDEILHWLGDWGDSLTYEIRNRKNEKQEESQDEWIEVIEKMLPLSLIATKGGIESLISLCSTLIEGERKRAQTPKYTFWQGWQEKNPQTSTAPCQPPSPQQMFQDKHTTCSRALEVKSMLQELLDSAMFSTGELRAIRYISSVVENLSKALILQQEKNKRLETKYRRLKTEMVKELSSQRLSFQKSLQTLETQRDALLKQVDALGKKCHELFLRKHTLEYKLKKAELALSQARETALILDDSPDAPERKTLPEEVAVMEETKQEHEDEEEEQLLWPLVQRSIDMDMGWGCDSQPSSDQSLPSMITNPEIVDVVSSKDTKILEPESLSSAESQDDKDPNQKDFLQEEEEEEEDLQNQLHVSKQQSPESIEKEVDQSTQVEHWEKKLRSQRQKQNWLQERPQQGERERTPLEREHQERWHQRQREGTLLEREHQERPQQQQRERTPLEREHQERWHQRQREGTPLQREHQERPQQWQRERTPLEREHQERPQQQQKERTPLEREHQERWHQRQREGTPLQREHQERPQQRQRERTPLEREHQERPQQWQRERTPLEREHQERPQQQQRERTPLEREHQERPQQRKLEEAPKENVVQGEEEQESPRRDAKRKPTMVTSQGTFSKAEAPSTAPLSQAQSVQQGRRLHQPIAPRNQRAVSSTELNQKSGAHQVPTKPRKTATSPALGLTLYKRTQSPLHITSIPLKEKVYHMDANALRENLRLFLGNGHLGLPAAVRSKALKLTTSAMELSLLRLQCLCLKYIHYRHLQSLRQEMINHIQDMQKTRAPYQAQNLSIFLANINSLQNLKMQAWTDRQRAVEQKYQECLSHMAAVLPKLRLECNIPLQTPRITTPKLRRTKSSPSLLRSTQSSSPSFKQLFISNSLDSASLQKARQGDHMKAVWKTDVTSSSYLIEEKTPGRLHWEQLGGHPDIPRLLTLDTPSCHHKSMMWLKDCCFSRCTS